MFIYYAEYIMDPFDLENDGILQLFDYLLPPSFLFPFSEIPSSQTLYLLEILYLNLSKALLHG